VNYSVATTRRATDFLPILIIRLEACTRKGQPRGRNEAKQQRILVQLDAYKSAHAPNLGIPSSLLHSATGKTILHLRANLHSHEDVVVTHCIVTRTQCANAATCQDCLR
jgi:hypothetical protein